MFRNEQQVGITTQIQIYVATKTKNPRRIFKVDCGNIPGPSNLGMLN